MQHTLPWQDFHSRRGAQRGYPSVRSPLTSDDPHPERRPRLLRRDRPNLGVVAPLERFLREETSSAGLLMAAAVIALVWANVAGGSYEDVWSSEVVIEFGPLHFEEELLALVNELLMAVFFYVVALDLERHDVEEDLSLIHI